jgi:hypothetical protein
MEDTCYWIWLEPLIRKLDAKEKLDLWWTEIPLDFHLITSITINGLDQYTMPPRAHQTVRFAYMKRVISSEIKKVLCD